MACVGYGLPEEVKNCGFVFNWCKLSVVLRFQQNAWCVKCAKRNGGFPVALLPSLLAQEVRSIKTLREVTWVRAGLQKSLKQFALTLSSREVSWPVERSGGKHTKLRVKPLASDPDLVSARLPKLGTSFLCSCVT